MSDAATATPAVASAGEPPLPAVEPDDVSPLRAVLAGPAIGLLALLWAVLATDHAGVSLRDPDNVAGRRLIGVLLLVVVLVVVDVVVRAALRSPRRRPTREALLAVRRERWSTRRALVALGALVGFYLSYFAYRNLKSVLPLLRPGDLFDEQLADIDRTVFFGHDPAALLHSLLGTGQVPAQLLSSVYVLYVLFVPLLVGLTLVFARSQRQGLFLVAAMSLNWPLGNLSYQLVPSLGPVYHTPNDFTALPGSAAGDLQELLLRQRERFLENPRIVERSQDIAAFASLHVSMLLTIALAASLLHLGRNVRVVLWIFFALSTVSTLYLGWHYAVDDVAGALIGVVALLTARVLTGYKGETAVAGGSGAAAVPGLNAQASGRSRPS